MEIERPDERADGAVESQGGSLARAAANAVSVCLGASSEDRAVIVFDKGSKGLASALKSAFETVGAFCALCDMDAFGGRPLTMLPAAIAKTMTTSTVSAFAVTSMPGEISVRRALLDLVAEHGVRHAHMPSITEPVFVDGLSMSYGEVARFVERLTGTLEGAREIRMTSPGGTDLSFTWTEPPVIEKLDGLIEPGVWQNLPSGQIVMMPSDVEGVFVADANLGDWFEHTYRVSEHPVRLELEGGRVRNILCDNRKLARDLRLFLNSSANAGRISELVVGANLGLTQKHKSALFDAYKPGASITIGAVPAPDRDWTSITSVPIFGDKMTLVVNGRRVMTDDVFEADLLP